MGNVSIPNKNQISRSNDSSFSFVSKIHVELRFSLTVKNMLGGGEKQDL